MLTFRMHVVSLRRTERTEEPRDRDAAKDDQPTAAARGHRTFRTRTLGEGTVMMILQPLQQRSTRRR